jgi:acyl carrier protein
VRSEYPQRHLLDPLAREFVQLRKIGEGMKRDEFIREFAEMLDVDPATLTEDTDMETLENWDSVGYLSAMVLIDEKVGVAISPDVISNAKSFGAILGALQGKFD